MAGVADVDLQLGLGGAGGEGVAAAALHDAVHVLRMNTLLHWVLLTSLVSDQGAECGLVSDQALRQAFLY